MPHDYGPYVKVEIETLDPNGEVPERELSCNRVNPFDKGSKGNKRAAEDSPENQNSRKKNREIPDWRVGEFLWMFLEGTKTTPDYKKEDVNLNSLEETESEKDGEDAEEQSASAETDTNLDN